MKIKLKASITLGSAKDGNAAEHTAGAIVDVDKKLAAQLIAADYAESHGAADKAEAPAPAPTPAAPAPAPAP